MNPIKDEKLFFSPYYDEIAVNEVIQAPRDRGEFVMATDNHILIKVDKSLLKGEYQKAKKPNLAPIIENGNIRLTLAQLEEALSKCPQEEEEEEVQPYISGEFSVSAVKKSNIAELFFDESGDRWYKVKAMFISIDEKSAVEKKKASYFLVQASNFKEALDNFNAGMKGTMADYEIAAISETAIEDVYLAKSETTNG